MYTNPHTLTHTGAVLLPLFCRDLRARRGLHGVLQDLRHLAASSSSWSLLLGGREGGEGGEDEVVEAGEEGDENGLLQLRRLKGGQQQRELHPRGRIPSGAFVLGVGGVMW